MSESRNKLPIGDCRKVRITDRIACKAKMLSEGRWKVTEWCKEVINSTSQLLWDAEIPTEDLITVRLTSIPRTPRNTPGKDLWRVFKIDEKRRHLLSKLVLRLIF